KKGEPVDVVSGANIDDFVDYELDGPIPLRWGRAYDSSLNGCDSPVGYGYRHEYQRELRRDVDGFRYIDQRGRAIGFPDFPKNTVSRANMGFALRRIDDRFYKVSKKKKLLMEFEFMNGRAPARWARLKSGSHSVDFQYDDWTRLRKIIDSRH